VPGGLALSDSEKAEALADSLEAQFQPVDDPSDPALTERVDVAMRAYVYTHTWTELTSPFEVLQELTVGKDSGPNGVPKRVLSHVPKCAITFLIGAYCYCYCYCYFYCYC
jgi:hypothetical protein